MLVVIPEFLSRIIALLLTETVHDTRLNPPSLAITEAALYQLSNVLDSSCFTLLGPHLVLQIGPVEAGQEPLGLLHTQLIEDVTSHSGGGCGC